MKKILICKIKKGIVFQDLIKNRNLAESAPHIYVGDGTNDYCPGLALGTTGSFFVKKNYSLFKRLQNPEYSEKLKCKLIYWSNANEIIENL